MHFCRTFFFLYIIVMHPDHGQWNESRRKKTSDFRPAAVSSWLCSIQQVNLRVQLYKQTKKRRQTDRDSTQSPRFLPRLPPILIKLVIFVVTLIEATAISSIELKIGSSLCAFPTTNSRSKKRESKWPCVPQFQERAEAKKMTPIVKLYFVCWGSFHNGSKPYFSCFI